MGTSRRTDLRIDPDADASAIPREPGLSTSASPKPKTPQYGHGIVKKQSMALLRKAFNAYDEEHTGGIPVSSVSELPQTHGNLRSLNCRQFWMSAETRADQFFCLRRNSGEYLGNITIPEHGQIHLSHNRGYF
jgi:hypothetical protein